MFWSGATRTFSAKPLTASCAARKKRDGSRPSGTVAPPSGSRKSWRIANLDPQRLTTKISLISDSTHEDSTHEGSIKGDVKRKHLSLRRRARGSLTSSPSVRLRDCVLERGSRYVHRFRDHLRGVVPCGFCAPASSVVAIANH